MRMRSIVTKSWAALADTYINLLAVLYDKTGAAYMAHIYTHTYTHILDSKLSCLCSLPEGMREKVTLRHTFLTWAIGGG
jgi:hypothetical protein